MRIDPEDLRRHYESLSDEGLLDIDRSDLVPVAQGIFDEEIARRGLERPPEEKEEGDGDGYHRPLPVFRAAADWDFASQLGADTDDGPSPAWLENAACPWSAYIYPDADYIGTGVEVQAALREAGIPSRIVVNPSEPPPTPGSLYCVMVPGDLATRACSVVERRVFNRMAVAEWRSQLQAFSDEQLRALNPEDFWGALLERAESLKQAYLDEIARRNLQAAPAERLAKCPKPWALLSSLPAGQGILSLGVMRAGSDLDQNAPRLQRFQPSQGRPLREAGVPCDGCG